VPVLVGAERRIVSTPEPDGFAHEWAAAWNRRDVDAVLAHFHDDVVFTSPVAAEIVPDSAGVVHGKAALREYWCAALAAVPDLHFDVVGVYGGASVLVINYRSTAIWSAVATGRICRAASEIGKMPYSAEVCLWRTLPVRCAAGRRDETMEVQDAHHAEVDHCWGATFGRLRASRRGAGRGYRTRRSFSLVSRGSPAEVLRDGAATAALDNPQPRLGHDSVPRLHHPRCACV
jgi:hypothetical protein